jgi:putative membrane protein
VDAHFVLVRVAVTGIIAFLLDWEKSMTLILRWILNALALMAVAYLYPGVAVSGFFAALVAALVLGLVNAVIRPILILLTLPINILTLGLFTFVINALLFWFVAEIIKGFTVSGGFVAALIGSLLYSLITLLTSWLVFSKKPS